ncbi:NADP-dependent oxidoreductase [Hymenobacter jeollabukensis]|uniref:NADP-dependent oxidoreductase n=1 Tax=Hymenobacter jeollabukensis TaxID=2025313 RepID=A0A5R8WVU2_9BACT|nr:NADP-dependent oxidoreductase [Hymenobacter jeollabukensis]TLM95545.1 NADP-dependent oxidoreductase [Hymenobacter jeollabukensis]
MNAFLLTGTTGPDSLQTTTLSTPTIGPAEVLVQVIAISLNPVDVKTTYGKGVYGRLKDEQPLIPGWDISGVVSAVGADVTDFKVGDEVFGMVNFPGHGRAYAEYMAAPAAHLARKPASISHEEAAATTLAALTAWQALVTKAHVQPGQRVLIHAAAGGVGHFAVQLAKELGAYVIGTSSAAKRDFVLSLGADEHVDYTQVRFEDAVQPVDMVLDAIGGDNMVRSLDVVKPGGTLISIPSGLSPDITERAAAKGIHGYFFLVSSDGTDMQRLAERLADGRLRAHVSQALPFAELTEALRLVESGKTQGKVVVVL